MQFMTRSVRTGTGFPISNPQHGQSQTRLSSSHRPKHPSLVRLRRFRNFVLPLLLVLVFTMLVLGAIYAYCVAKPYTDIAARLAVDSNAEADGSLFAVSRPSPLARRATVPASQDPLPDEREHGSPTALMFYSLTVPGVSLFHLGFELLIHHHTPHHLMVRAISLALLTASSLLVVGWIINISFWMHCELPPFNKSGKAICPVQARDHFMYGIHELSIAKAVIGWVIVSIYLTHLTFLGMAHTAFAGGRRLRSQWQRGEHSGKVDEVEIHIGLDEGLRKAMNLT